MILENIELVVKYLLSIRIVKDGHWLIPNQPNHNGYVGIAFQKERELIHRLSCAYFYNLDLTNSNLQALHRLECTRKDCWNPDHLYVGTASNNAADNVKLNGVKISNEDRGKYNRNKTRCKQGHEYTEENTYLAQRRNGIQRQCKICRKLADEKRKK